MTPFIGDTMFFFHGKSDIKFATRVNEPLNGDFYGFPPPRVKSLLQYVERLTGADK